jgi:hypothetical protein
MKSPPRPTEAEIEMNEGAAPANSPATWAGTALASTLRAAIVMLLACTAAFAAGVTDAHASLVVRMNSTVAVYTHPTADYRSIKVGSISPGASFIAECFWINTDARVLQNPAYLRTTVNGVKVFLTDRWTSTVWNTTADLVRQGIPQCPSPVAAYGTLPAAPPAPVVLASASAVWPDLTATRPLGGMDLNGWCQRTNGYWARVLDANNAYTWRCGNAGIDLNAACRWQYGQGWASLASASNAYSWSCRTYLIPVREQHAIIWLRRQIGATGTDGWCELLMENAFGTSGQYPTALADFNDQAAHGHISTNMAAMPVGALAFFRNDYDQGHGHVMAYIGNARYVSSGGRVAVVGQETGGRFIGWSLAPAGWSGV